MLPMLLSIMPPLIDIAKQILTLSYKPKIHFSNAAKTIHIMIDMAITFYFREKNGTLHGKSYLTTSDVYTAFVPFAIQAE